MASFNTVAGCVLASALFAMVVGKVSNAVVHPHKLEKPALAVADEAPTETAAAAPAEELPPIGPLLAGANVVATASALVRHGPEHMAVLVDGLGRWLSESGFTSIEEIRGRLDATHLAHADAFLRAQYVRTLSGAPLTS